MWPLYKACKDARETTETLDETCSERQKEFEDQHCPYYQLLGFHCYELSKCLSEEGGDCGSPNADYAAEAATQVTADGDAVERAGETVVASVSYTPWGNLKTSTCGLMEERWRQRQNDNETAEHIDCLLGALMSAMEEGELKDPDSEDVQAESDKIVEKQYVAARKNRQRADAALGFCRGNTEANRLMTCTGDDSQEMLMDDGGDEDHCEKKCSDKDACESLCPASGGLLAGQCPVWRVPVYRKTGDTWGLNTIDGTNRLAATGIDGLHPVYYTNTDWQRGWTPDEVNGGVSDSGASLTFTKEGETRTVSGVASIYDYFAVTASGDNLQAASTALSAANGKNFASELLPKRLFWIIPCGGSCEDSECPELEPPPCTVGDVEYKDPASGAMKKVVGFKSKYYSLVKATSTSTDNSEEDGFLGIFSSIQLTGTDQHPGWKAPAEKPDQLKSPSDSDEGIERWHSSERDADRIVCEGSGAKTDSTGGERYLVPTETGKNSFPQAMGAEGTALFVGQTDPLTDPQKETLRTEFKWCTLGSIRALESDQFEYPRDGTTPEGSTTDSKSATLKSWHSGSDELDGSGFSEQRTADLSYIEWKKRACWDVDACDKTLGDGNGGQFSADELAQGKCHSYYHWQHGSAKASTLTFHKAEASTCADWGDAASQVTVDSETVCISNKPAETAGVMNAENMGVTEDAEICQSQIDEHPGSVFAIQAGVFNFDTAQALEGGDAGAGGCVYFKMPLAHHMAGDTGNTGIGGHVTSKYVSDAVMTDDSDNALSAEEMEGGVAGSGNDGRDDDEGFVRKNFNKESTDSVSRTTEENDADDQGLAAQTLAS